MRSSKNEGSTALLGGTKVIASLLQILTFPSSSSIICLRPLSPSTLSLGMLSSISLLDVTTVGESPINGTDLYLLASSKTSTVLSLLNHMLILAVSLSSLILIKI